MACPATFIAFRFFHRACRTVSCLFGFFKEISIEIVFLSKCFILELQLDILFLFKLLIGTRSYFLILRDTY